MGVVLQGRHHSGREKPSQRWEEMFVPGPQSTCPRDLVSVLSTDCSGVHCPRGARGRGTVSHIPIQCYLSTRSGLGRFPPRETCETKHNIVSRVQRNVTRRSGIEACTYRCKQTLSPAHSESFPGNCKTSCGMTVRSCEPKFCSRFHGSWIKTQSRDIPATVGGFLAFMIGNALFPGFDRGPGIKMQQGYQGRRRRIRGPEPRLVHKGVYHAHIRRRTESKQNYPKMSTFCFFFFFGPLANERQLSTRCSLFAIAGTKSVCVHQKKNKFPRRTFPVCIFLSLAFLRQCFLLFLFRLQPFVCKVHLHRPMYPQYVRVKYTVAPFVGTDLRRRTSSSIS